MSSRTKSQFENHYSPSFDHPRARQSSTISRSGSLGSSCLRKRQGSTARLGEAASIMKRARQRSRNNVGTKSKIQESEGIPIGLGTSHGRVQQHPNRVSSSTPWNDSPESLRLFKWSNDPYEVDSALVLHCMNLYFAHINLAIYSIFDREVFMRWLHSSRTKSTEEKIVLYSMLAISLYTRLEKLEI